IAFSSRAQTNWHNILTDAANTESLNAILNVARAAYGNNSVFMVAYNQYLQFIDKGRRIEAPGQPPTADEFVYGDKVGGDTITAGNITAPVAIGDGATVTVIHPAPLPRIPLERPARAEYFQNRKHELAQLL